VQAFGPIWETYKKKLEESGIDSATVDAIIGPIEAGMSLAKNEATKGALDTVGALQGILENQLSTGFLDTKTFAAVQGQAKTALDQMLAGGADPTAAIQAVAPLLAQLQQTAQATGQTLDSNTQAMIAQAQAAGVAFPVEPIERMVTLMETLVTGMGFQLPASVQQTTTALQTASTAASSSFGSISSDALAASGTMIAAFDGVADQITSAIDPAAQAIEGQFASAFDAATGEAAQFIQTLAGIGGTTIPLGFKFNAQGGGAPGGGEGGIPAFANEGVLKASPPRGRLFVAGEREDEVIMKRSRLKGLLGGRGTQISNSPSIVINGSGLNEGQLISVLDRAMKNNTNQIATRFKRVAQGKD